MPMVSAGAYGTIRAIIHLARHTQRNGITVRNTSAFSHALVETETGVNVYPRSDAFAVLKERLAPVMADMKPTSKCYTIASEDDGYIAKGVEDHPEYFFAMPGGLLRLPLLTKQEFAAHLARLPEEINIAPKSHILYVDRTSLNSRKMLGDDLLKDITKRIEMMAPAFLPDDLTWKLALIREEACT